MPVMAPRSLFMHMADALISPAVGGVLWAAAAGLIAYSSKRVARSLRQELVPLMGVLGAFVFAAQMINFTIPGTGSSGHLGGGLLLAILLGPHAAFLTIASVLTIQAFFFADGGLLALGCNIINLGVFPAFVAYPLLYRPLAARRSGLVRVWAAAILAAVVGLQLGAMGVVLETMASGISELRFGTFVLLMAPIHLAIGVVEGLVTAIVVAFVVRVRPEALPAAGVQDAGRLHLRPVLLGLLAATVVVGAFLSWFASAHPDGLEWSIAKVTGREEFAGRRDAVHARVAMVQEMTALLPDYEFKTAAEESAGGGDASAPWPAVSAGTSLSGLAGGLMTLLLAGLTGLALKARP
jgi:cobalt/nickel transport system permease protein